MSGTIIAVLVNLFVMILPWIGVTIPSEALTTTIQTLVAVGTGTWIWISHIKTQEAIVGKGNVNMFGGVK